MDQFLAEYYGTLGFGVEKVAYGPGASPGMEPHAEQALREGQVAQRRAAIKQNLQKRKALSEFDEADKIMRERMSGRGGGAASLPRGTTQYKEPIGPPPPERTKVQKAKDEAVAKSKGLRQRAGAWWGRRSRGGKAALIAGAAAPVVAAGGYAAYRAMKNREKRSSDAAFDQLVEERAFGILYENGLADDYGNVVPPDEFEYEKTAGDFDSIVDSAALELLEANGYPVEWD
jgi:hypothetical protein